MSFDGIPRDALAFFEELRADNSRDFWQQNKARYDQTVKTPILELLHNLEPAFGVAKLFRPYRDVRFSKDKRPYKENIAATIGGRYLSLSADGLYAGAGAHMMAGAALTHYREAVDTAGDELEAALLDLASHGYQLSKPSLKRGPTGVSPDHPHIELLKHKSVTATRDFGRPDWLHGPEVETRVAQVFGDMEALVSWFTQHAW